MAADRPLLVVHDEEEGHLVYDPLLVLADDDEGTVVVAGCSPRPVARFPSSCGCRAFAASGGAVLGAFYDFWGDTLFHDMVMQVGGYGFWERQASPRMRDAEGRFVRCWPRGRGFGLPREFGKGYMDAPAMLPLMSSLVPPGDVATVIRMDTVLFDGIYGFEKLRLLPDGSWHAVPLPKPPLGYLPEKEVVFVSAYCAVGTRVWITVTGKGTFSLDVADEHSAAWQMEGMWHLPFQGRGLHVPELGGSVVFGLTAGDKGVLCACDVGGNWAMQHVWPETFPRPWEEGVMSSGGRDVSRPRDMPSLAYLGDGRFCICRPMSTMEWTRFAPPLTYDACCFLVVELKRCSSSSWSRLELAKRGKMTYMWPPQGRQSSYIGFIQPATG